MTHDRFGDIFLSTSVYFVAELIDTLCPQTTDIVYTNFFTSFIVLKLCVYNMTSLRATEGQGGTWSDLPASIPDFQRKIGTWIQSEPMPVELVFIIAQILSLP